MSDNVFCVRASWDHVGGPVTYTATCERCGVELDIDAGPLVTVIRVPNMKYEQLEQIGAAWRAAREHGHPLLVTKDVDVSQLSPRTLDLALAEHARSCGKSPAPPG